MDLISEAPDSHQWRMLSYENVSSIDRCGGLQLSAFRVVFVVILRLAFAFAFVFRLLIPSHSRHLDGENWRRRFNGSRWWGRLAGSG